MTDPRTGSRLRARPDAGITSMVMLAYACDRAPNADEGHELVRRAFAQSRADRYTVHLAGGGRKVSLPALDA